MSPDSQHGASCSTGRKTLAFMGSNSSVAKAGLPFLPADPHWEGSLSTEPGVSPEPHQERLLSTEPGHGPESNPQQCKLPARPPALPQLA